MKLIRILTSVIGILVLVACSTNNQGTTENDTYPPPQVLPPTPVVEDASGVPYPDFNDGSTIPPSVAQALILLGSVDRVSINQAKEVILFLSDGRVLKFVAPYDNAIQNWVDQCGEVCKNLEIIRE